MHESSLARCVQSTSYQVRVSAAVLPAVVAAGEADAAASTCRAGIAPPVAAATVAVAAAAPSLAGPKAKPVSTPRWAGVAGAPVVAAPAPAAAPAVDGVDVAAPASRCHQGTKSKAGMLLI